MLSTWADKAKNIKTIKIINYTDENIFGVKFSKRAKHIKCAIDYLTLNHLVDKNGMLKKNMYDRIRLRYIWQYLVYIRNHNKELSVLDFYLIKLVIYIPNYQRILSTKILLKLLLKNYITLKRHSMEL